MTDHTFGQYEPLQGSVEPSYADGFVQEEPLGRMYMRPKMGFKNFFSSKRCRNKRENKTINNCDNNEEEISIEGGYLMQFVAGISIYLLNLNHGIHAGWTSPALPYLSNRTSDFTISEEEGTWIASIPSLGIMFGILLCPFLLDKIGRKYTILIYAVPHLLSWIIIILAKNVLTLCMARFISGIGSGGTFSAGAIYFAEIGGKEIRGILITILNVCSNVGILLIVTSGAFLSYEIMNAIMILVPVLAFLMFFLMPKTPYFYLMNNNEKDAIKTLMKLRGMKHPGKLHSEIESMKKSVLESQNSQKSSLKELFSKGNRKAFLILLFAKAAKDLSGVAAIEAYAEEIFSYSNFSLSPKYSTMILGGVRILSGLLSTLFIDRARKIMFLISGVLTALSLGIVGLFFFLDSQPDFDTSSFTWLPLVGLISYLIFSNMGLIPIPVIFLGELFSINAKGKAIALTTIFSAAFMFISKFGFQELKSAFGIYMPFCIFALCCIVNTIIVYIISPDTTRKNLEEVQNSLIENKRTILVSDSLELGSIAK